MGTSALKRFQDHGYVVLEGLLEPRRDLRPLIKEYESLVDQLAQQWYREKRLSSLYSGLPLRRRLALIARETKSKDRGSRSFAFFVHHLEITLPQIDITEDTPMHCGAAVFGLLRNPKLLDAVETLIGPEIYSNPVQHVRIKPPEQYLPANQRHSPEVSRTVWHQDLGTVLEEADNSNLITVWVPVTEATLENSCLMVVPGSHKQGLRVHSSTGSSYSRHQIPEEFIGPAKVRLQMNPGDVLFLHRMTIHSSTPNRSDSVRWSFDLRYNPIGQPTGRPGFPGFIARSRAHPETELRDPERWAESWHRARSRLAKMELPTFQRWKVD